MSQPTGLPPLARAGLAALVGVTFVHLAAQVGDPDGLVANVTQDLLMPVLAWSLAAATSSPRSRRVRLVLLALGFSWLGDAAPDLAPDDLAFLVMVGFFLLAQATYIAAFLPLRDRSVIGRRPVATLPYAAVFVALIALTRAGAGSLLVPVIVYGLALTTMALLATGLGRLAGVGGMVFMLSDALIAIGAFTDLDLPVHGFWVMLTYVLGQALIVLAVIRAGRGGEAGCGTSSPARAAPYPGQTGGS
jgi:uncharacterized membrane protein YhhN